jgi:hypothetical protein
MRGGAHQTRFQQNKRLGIEAIILMAPIKTSIWEGNL